MTTNTLQPIQVGLTFFSRPTNQITILKQFNATMFQVEQMDIITKETRSNIILSSDDILSDLNNQETIKQVIQKQIDFNNNQSQLQLESESKRLQEQQEEEFCHGYCDNFSPMQKAKILQALNKQVKYGNEWNTRKEHIYNLLSEGYTLRIVDKMLTNSKKTKSLERKETVKMNVPIIENNNSFYTITKTEYDYGKYLLENVLN